MSERIKRLIIMVAGAVFLSLICFFLGDFSMNKNIEEMRKYYNSIEGVWSAADTEYKLEIRRVTSAHVVFSIWDKANEVKTDFFSATVEDEENRYRFSAGSMTDYFGDDGYYKKDGIISLQEGAVQLQLTTTGGKTVSTVKLTKKEPLPKKNKISLDSYLNQVAKVPDSCISFQDSEGRNWFIHAEMTKDKYEYSFDGINRYSFETDCESRWGENHESTQINPQYKQVVYRKENQVFTVLFDQYGLVSQIECMSETENNKREGDFLMYGDTVMKYLGSYQKDTKISLPEHTKKLASGAFSVSNDVNQNKGMGELTIDIPPNVEIEKGAFANCKRLHIRLLNGRKVIEEGTFAHLLSDEATEATSNWVRISLPTSIQRLERDAFNQMDAAQSWPDYVKGITQHKKSPVVVENAGYVKEMEENALCGAVVEGADLYRGNMMTTFPKHILIYMKTQSSRFCIPKKVKKLKKGDFVFLHNSDIGFVEQGDSNIGSDWYDDDWFESTIKLSDELEEIEEDSILPNGEMPILIAGENSDFFVNNKDDWLFSKDMTELYATAFSDRIKIPDSVKNIHGYALYGIDGDYAIDGENIVIPAGVQKMSRNAFYKVSSDIYFEGAVPEFYGDFSEDTLAEMEQMSKSIYVKRGMKRDFIHALLKGQKVTEERRKEVESKIKGY